MTHEDRPEIAVCQKCGRVAWVDESVLNSWLIEKRRDDPGIYVVRCPMHITEWAMRNTVVGRTRELRRRSFIGRMEELPPPRQADPMPARFRGAGGRLGGDKDKPE